MGLINHCAPLSTSEVGLNSHHHAAVRGLWSRLVAPTGTKGGHWYRFVPPTGTNSPLWYRLVPPTGTEGRRFPPFGLLKRDLWSRLVAPTGTKGGHWYRLVA